LRNVSRILQSIKDYKGFKTNAELADFLGVSRSTISNWIARETIDEDLIKAKIPEIRLEFLREGEFPMTEQRDLVQILLEKISRMERKIEQLEKELKDHGKR
jgi:DNA-binding MarR family transcriptional regulator